MSKKDGEVGLPPLVEAFMNDVVYKISPSFQIRNKAHPKGLYWWASKIVGIFNKEMDTGYVTVINGQCWFPSSYFDEEGNLHSDVQRQRDVIRTLAHEAVHEHDRIRLGSFPFAILYLLPQVLAVFGLLSLLAFWDLSWLWCLLFFLFLAPIPAPGRAWIEARAYRVNVTLARYVGWDPRLVIEGIYNKNFGSAAYFFMMPFKGWVFNQLLSTSHESDQPYKDIFDWYRKHFDINQAP